MVGGDGEDVGEAAAAVVVEFVVGLVGLGDGDFAAGDGGCGQLRGADCGGEVSGGMRAAGWGGGALYVPTVT